MDAEFWRGAWSRQQIGFHNVKTNPYLMKFWPRFDLDAATAVFVPLAGKSVDMVWLAEQGHNVIGVELSEIAVQAFFDENDLSPTKRQDGALVRWESGNITIFCGDFFDLTQEQVGVLTAVYDRASMVALPLEMRQRYVARMAKLLPVGAQTLLIVFDYDQQKMSGPPFSVTRSEVDALYRPMFSVTHLQTKDILSKAPGFASRGFSEFNQVMYRLERL